MYTLIKKFPLNSDSIKKINSIYYLVVDNEGLRPVSVKLEPASCMLYHLTPENVPILVLQRGKWGQIWLTKAPVPQQEVHGLYAHLRSPSPNNRLEAVLNSRDQYLLTLPRISQAISE